MRKREPNPHRHANADDICATVFLCIVAAALFAIACLTVFH
jgi:hypothetical protein